MIRDLLLERRRELLRNKSELVGQMIDDVPDRIGDGIDVATDEQTDSTILSLETRYAAELVEIDAALSRLDAGTYGECEECGEEIAAARLQSQPLARRCVDCQERIEVDAKRRRKRPGLMDEFSS